MCFVVTSLVLEYQCCQGHTVGGVFDELRDIIKLVNMKARIGVSLNTCHLVASGESRVRTLAPRVNRLLKDRRLHEWFVTVKGVFERVAKHRVTCMMQAMICARVRDFHKP